LQLYETHIPVADTAMAERFYLEVVGLPFAHADRERNIIFLWAGSREQGMLGLWGPGTTYGPAPEAPKHHLAFAVPWPELLELITKLQRHGIQTLGFGGGILNEPTVIGWMPSAQIYFRDPDGHMLEFISILPGDSRPGFVGAYSEWLRLQDEKR
jgi:lactoylglutathione lyase